MPAGDIATTKQFVNGQLGVDGVDLNQITQLASIQPAFYTAQSAASSPGDSDILLLLSAGGSYEKVLYQNFFANSKWLRASQGGTPQYVSTINGAFDVWQRNVQFGSLLGVSPTATYTADRWVVLQNYTAFSAGNPSVMFFQLDLLKTFPQTAFAPQARYCLRVQAATTGAAPNAGDYCLVSQKIEYRQLRKLYQSGHSLSLWLRCSIAGTFSIVIQDAVQGQSYKQDVNVGTPNTWQRVTIQNIPAFPGGANIGANESDLAAIISVVIAAGSTFQSATQNSWLTGNFLSTATSGNPLIPTGGATLDITLVQHESGPVCTPFGSDPDYASTLLKCQRYYAQSYDDLAGNYFGNTADNNTICAAGAGSSGNQVGGFTFPTSMRVVPSVTIYNPNSGAANSLRDVSSALNKSVSSLILGRKAVQQITLGASVTTTDLFYYHYTANAEL